MNLESRINQWRLLARKGGNLSDMARLVSEAAEIIAELQLKQPQTL